MRIRYKQAYNTAGFKINRKAEGVLTDAVIAAQAIPNSSVELIDSSGGVAHVTSMSDMSVQYHVTDAGKPTARCTWPQELLHCKHVVKVISLSQATQMRRSFQLLAHELAQACKAWTSCTATLPPSHRSSLIPWRELEDVLALTRMES